MQNIDWNIILKYNFVSFLFVQLFIDPGKLLPLNRFLPKAPQPKGPKKKGPPGGVGGARGRGGFGGGRGASRGRGGSGKFKIFFWKNSTKLIQNDPSH